jgi:hypothetical protein
LTPGPTLDEGLMLGPRPDEGLTPGPTPELAPCANPGVGAAVAPSATAANKTATIFNRDSLIDASWVSRRRRSAFNRRQRSAAARPPASDKAISPTP